MLPRDALTLVMLMTGLAGTVAAAVTRNPSDPANVDSEDYDSLDNEARSDKGNKKGSSKVREVRCYCNNPICVPQSYMCRGIRCFTKLPTSVDLPLLKAGFDSGCVNNTFREQRCPEESVCCDTDLCNLEDSPEMKNTLNTILTEAMNNQRIYVAPLYPKGQDGGQTTARWFSSAIVVAICGFVVLLIIANLAVRWLHPIPPQNVNKFVPCRTSDNGPPLLGLPKVPLV